MEEIEEVEEVEKMEEVRLRFNFGGQVGLTYFPRSEPVEVPVSRSGERRTVNGKNRLKRLLCYDLADRLPKKEPDIAAGLVHIQT